MIYMWISFLGRRGLYSDPSPSACSIIDNTVHGLRQSVILTDPHYNYGAREYNYVSIYVVTLYSVQPYLQVRTTMMTAEKNKKKRRQGVIEAIMESIIVVSH